MLVDSVTPLNRIWWWTFMLELPLVGFSLLYWFVAPDEFLRSVYTFDEVPAPARALLMSYAGVVLTLVFWFYARMLLSPTVHMPTFRRYQEALLLGDVWIVATWGYGLATGTPATVTGVVGTGLAAFWGLVRVVFLLQTSERAVRSRS